MGNLRDSLTRPLTHVVQVPMERANVTTYWETVAGFHSAKAAEAWRERLSAVKARILVLPAQRR